MSSLRVSSRPPAVKGHTLSLAPEGWFSVKDYLSFTVREKVPGVTEFRTWPVLSLAERRPPTSKALSMRLLRYCRQGLLERKREGHKFLYKATRKGKLRGLSLKKRYTSLYEYLPDASFKHHLAKTGKDTRLQSFSTKYVVIPEDTKMLELRQIVRKEAGLDVVRRELKCRSCGKPLVDHHVVVCPICHNLT